MRRQYFAEEENKRSSLRYSQGGALHTSRPPTGVDLALGLSGYDKFYNAQNSSQASTREVRTPTTLQAYKDEDEEMKRRVASLDAQEAKWQRIKATKNVSPFLGREWAHWGKNPRFVQIFTFWKSLFW